MKKQKCPSCGSEKTTVLTKKKVFMSSAAVINLLLASLYQLQAVSKFRCLDCELLFERRTRLARVGFVMLCVLMLLLALHLLVWLLEVVVYLVT